jgi:CrcB protein
MAGGGALGAVARYALLSEWPTQPGRFPWGTFVVNVSGSLLLGVLLVTLTGRLPRRTLARPVLGTAVIGAYTTFSTLAMETVLLLRAGHLPTAVLYVAASVAAGLVAFVLGAAAARSALKSERRIAEL